VVPAKSDVCPQYGRIEPDPPDVAISSRRRCVATGGCALIGRRGRLRPNGANVSARYPWRPSLGYLYVVSEKCKPAARWGRKATGPNGVSRVTERQEQKMSSLSGARPENAAGGPASHAETIRADMAASMPARPLAGSSLDALVRRQNPSVNPGQRLGFVPAQVR